jgi:hypothetical protein
MRGFLRQAQDRLLHYALRAPVEMTAFEGGSEAALTPPCRGEAAPRMGHPVSWHFHRTLYRIFCAGLDVEVVTGEEGLFFEGFADAGGGFGVGGGGEGAAQELESVEVVGTPFEGDGLGRGWGLEP